MPAFCIVPELAAKLKEAAKAGDITMQKLFDMTSSERRELFGKYTDNNTAMQINAGFEKAMISDQKKALSNWANDTFSSSQKQKAIYKDIINKIDDLDKQGLLTPENEKAYLQDLVAQKLGATITSEEAKNISQLSEAINNSKDKVNELGMPSLDYWQAKRSMDDYLNSLTPSSNIKVFLSTIGRGSMLFSPTSPLLNIESNTLMGALTSLTRRIESRRFQGLNNDYASKVDKYIRTVYGKSGYDLSRFMTVEGGRRVLGENYMHSQGKGPVRAVGRWFEDKIFKATQGKPDVFFAAKHFVDSINLQTTMIAKAEGLKGQAAKARALEIMKDAVKPEPKTDLGLQVHQKAEEDASFSTFTNKSRYEKLAMKSREIINTATGDIGVGETYVPFAKTPANVMGSTVEFGPVSFGGRTALGIFSIMDSMKRGIPFSESAKAQLPGITRSAIHAGLGVTLALAISSYIHPSDFIGAYPTNTKERELLKERNGIANSIRIGNRWISLDYFGPLAGQITAILYAEKYGHDNLGDMALQYGWGSISAIQNIPGWNLIANAYSVVTAPENKNATANAVSKKVGQQVLSDLESRTVPGFVGLLAKMTDHFQRQPDKNNIFSGIQSNLPFVRQGMPISHTLFGDQQTTEPWLSTFLFGSRVKTVQDSTILQNLVKLDSQGALPSITDTTSTSTTGVQLKKQIGDKQFNNALQYFGKNLKQGFLDTMNSDDYKNASPVDQQTMLNKVKSSTWRDTLDTYGYIKPSKG